MMKMKKGLALVLGLMMLFGCVGAYAADGTLIMATNPEFPPFEYVEGNTIMGLDADLAAEIAKDLGWELVIDAMAFDSIIAAVQSGKADVGIAGMSDREDRRLSVDFSTSYFDASQVCIVKEGSDIVDMDTLKGKLIGVQLGTTGDSMASELSTSIERYAKGLDAIMELQGGKLDAVVLDLPVAKNILKELNDSTLVMQTAIEFEPEVYAIAVAKNKPELLESINKTIERVNEDGTMAAWIAKYFGEE